MELCIPLLDVEWTEKDGVFLTEHFWVVVNAHVDNSFDSGGT